MRKVFLISILATILVAGAGYFMSMPASLPASVLPQDYRGDTVNGKTLFYAGGCGSCHGSPKGGKCDHPRVENKEILAGGRCLKTAFGTFFVPNISPDKENGIGRWSKIDFANAMLRGVSPRGQHYFPAFPYTSYHLMPIEDVLDLKAFMNTLAPSKGRNKPHELDFPYSMRRMVGLWKWLYFDHKTAAHRKTGSASQLARGRYLVEGPAHCGECHTPRDKLGGLRRDLAYSGAPAPGGEGWIPNITPHKTGLRSWTESQIADLLATGLTPDFDSIGGEMVSVQENLAKISASDRAAIAHYLKTLKPIQGLKRPKKKKSSAK